MRCRDGERGEGGERGSLGQLCFIYLTDIGGSPRFNQEVQEMLCLRPLLPSLLSYWETSESYFVLPSVILLMYPDE